MFSCQHLTQKYGIIVYFDKKHTSNLCNIAKNAIPFKVYFWRKRTSQLHIVHMRFFRGKNNELKIIEKRL